MCLRVLKRGLDLRRIISVNSNCRPLPFIAGFSSPLRPGAFSGLKRNQARLRNLSIVAASNMPAKAKTTKSAGQGKEASTLIEDKKGGTSKKIGGRRRDREAEVTVTGQERSLKRRRNRQDDIVLSAEPAEPGRAEEDEAASDLPTAVISPNLVAKQDPVLAEVAQSAEKFLDAVVKVKVRRRGSDTKFIAKVLAQGPECDIALLTVEEDAFWEPDLPPVHFGSLPRLQDSVSVVGFPIGGDTMSVTSGVVSRIEVTSYTHGATALLGMQIDAAINSGNSGGPAFNSRGECVGIAFQSLRGEDVENIGYVIPVDVVHHFIADFDKNGKFTSFPILGIEWQKMESPYMRKSMGMKDGQKGVLVRRVEPTASSNKVLRKGDILLSFDGIQLANDGTIQFRSGERISFSYLVSKKYTGDTATVELLRNGKKMDAEISLSSVNRLIPEHLDNRPPSYLILAGLIFTQVSAPYLRSEYGKDYDYDSPVKLLDLLLHGKCKRADQQVVVLGHVLAADCTIGYEDLQNYQVFAVNGKKLNKLKDLVDIVDSCKSEYLKFELEYDATVIIDTKVARAATKDIMTTHCIAFDRSTDLRS